MSSRMYESGAEKRKKKQRLEAAAQSQKGALDRFLLRETPPINDDHGHGDAAVDQAETPATTIVQDDDANNAGGRDHDASNTDSGGNDANIAEDINNSFQHDIFDPRTWDALDPKTIDILLQKGHKRDLSIEHGPRDKFSRRFSALSYTRVMSNGEKHDREWLVYSKELVRVFCFYCKLLRKGHVRGQLAIEGFNDWHHLGERLQEHEVSREHVTNMSRWYNLHLGFQENKTIDKVAQRELEKEREHWRKVLLQIHLIVKFLAEHNIAFRGSNSKLYQDSNGNFLGLVQMLAEFDPVIKDHVDRITNDQIHDHYLGPSIHNELINLLAFAIRSAIVAKVKEAKYFSVILDCTPDASSQE